MKNNLQAKGIFNKPYGLKKGKKIATSGGEIAILQKKNRDWIWKNSGK